MKKLEELFQYFPAQPDWGICWKELEQHVVLSPWIDRMRHTMQNPVWHGEGDVWTHTRLVCEELVRKTAFRALPFRQQQELFLSALLHDIGKVCCTRMEDRKLVSPHHGKKGASLARTILWKELDCAGSQWAQNFRETVCLLIRYHADPPHIWTQENTLRLLQIAANGELAKDFSISMLCLLAESDALGRKAEDVTELAEQVELFRLMAEENKCLIQPKKFASPYTQRAYFEGRLSCPDMNLYDATWGRLSC